MFNLIPLHNLLTPDMGTGKTTRQGLISQQNMTPEMSRVNKSRIRGRCVLSLHVYLLILLTPDMGIPGAPRENDAKVTKRSSRSSLTESSASCAGAAATY